MTGVELIAKERQRQIEEEGFTPEHDSQWKEGELVDAALCYLAPREISLRYYWPWDFKWWKPKDRVSDLVKAGALIAAEIDRLKRKEVADEQAKEADREAERAELWQPGDEPYEPDYWGAHYE